MSRLRRVNYMCSRTVSDPANRLLKRTDSEGSSSVAEKKSSVIPLFSKRSPLSDFRRAIKQGKGRSSKRKGNRRCPFLFAPAAGAATSRRPQTANPPLRFSGKLPARKGRTRLRQFVCLAQPVQKRSRPVRANTLAQFAHPGFPVQKRSRPERANTLTQFACPAQPVQKTSRNRLIK